MAVEESGGDLDKKNGDEREAALCRHTSPRASERKLTER